MVYRSEALLKEKICELGIRELLTDSRNMFTPESSLFFAIRTPGGNDGHRFIKELYDKGLRYFVVENLPEELPEDADFFEVENVVATLQSISTLHRDYANEIIAITGSRGKTTVKEMLFHLLDPIKKISRSPRSFNSQIGVPLSIWGIEKDTDIAVIEAGISKKGEMAILSELICPHVLIVNKIGSQHSEGFENHEAKIKEKLKLAEGRNVRRIIYPADDDATASAVHKICAGKELLGWSLIHKNADLFIEVVEKPEDEKKKLNYLWKGRKGWIELEAGTYKNWHYDNIATSLTFLLSEGFDEKVIQERFSRLYKINTRLNVTEGINGCSLIMDSYSSDVDSLQPALDFMLRRKTPYQQPVLIMSDLVHTGKDIDKTYKKIASVVKKNSIKNFIGVGPYLKKFSYLFSRKDRFYSDIKEMHKDITASDFVDEIILMKGSPEVDFTNLYRSLEVRNHETVLEINLDSLISNYNYFRSKVPRSTGIIAMVKASGYGMGSYELAKTLQDCGASMLAVATLDEGVELRRTGITMPIMVMNPRSENYKALFTNKLEPAVYSLEMLSRLIEEAEKAHVERYPIHIKIDTGMHRMGFLENEIDSASSLLSKTSKLRVSTLFSHLATADCLEMDQFTKLQFERFENYTKKISDSLGFMPKRHILNSAGILRFPEFHYDFVRLGIGLYGANTLPTTLEKTLAVVATLRTVIICIREINPPETVGYGKMGRLKKRSRVATLPIGYADGINRKFGNGRMKVLINGKMASTIGNICMDAMMIDVTEIECSEGDSVEIFGENIPVNTLSDMLETIPYEIFTSISPRVKRIYYRE